MSEFNKSISEVFNKYPELQVLQKLIRQRGLDAWLVGGTLRDVLLHKPVVDIDIATAGNQTEAIQAWARDIGGRWFWLDEDRGQSRVLTSARLTVDFTPLRAPTIDADLYLRDFSVNALALSLNDELTDVNLHDPLDGQVDLQKQVLRFCSERSLIDDPLRMLKGIRHAVTLPLVLNEESLQSIKQHAGLINNVAGERIHEELGKILSSPKPVDGFRLLAQSGLLKELLGESKSDFAAESCFADLASLQQRLNNIEFTTDTESAVADPFDSRALFLFATFLRSYTCSDLTELLHDKLRMSRQQERIILSLQQAPASQWFDQARQATGAREKALLVEQLGYFPDEQLLYWIAYSQQLSLETGRDLLTAFYQYQRLGRVPDLLSGHKVKELLPGQQEKEIGTWQQQIKAAELDKQIASQDEALKWLQQQISN